MGRVDSGMRVRPVRPRAAGPAHPHAAPPAAAAVLPLTAGLGRGAAGLVPWRRTVPEFQRELWSPATPFQGAFSGLQGAAVILAPTARHRGGWKGNLMEAWMKRFGRAMAALGVVVAMGATFAPAAAAAARPSANGLCGAKNMVNPNAKPHMMEAMDLHTAPQGDAGMRGAVIASSCPPTP